MPPLGFYLNCSRFGTPNAVGGEGINAKSAWLNLSAKLFLKDTPVLRKTRVNLAHTPCVSRDLKTLFERSLWGGLNLLLAGEAVNHIQQFTHIWGAGHHVCEVNEALSEFWLQRLWKLRLTCLVRIPMIFDVRWVSWGDIN